MIAHFSDPAFPHSYNGNDENQKSYWRFKSYVKKTKTVPAQLMNYMSLLLLDTERQYSILKLLLDLTGYTQPILATSAQNTNIFLLKQK